MILAMILACVHKVQVTSAPEGAMVRYGGRDVGVTPVVLDVRPFGARRVEARLLGYRPFVTKLPLGMTTTRFVGDALLLRPYQGLGLAPAATLELRLVKEHGGVGTWEEGDAP